MRRPWLGWAAVGILAAATIGIGVSAGGFTPAAAGAVAPEYAAPGLDGDTVALSDLRGKVVILNLWATWCAPCVTEMPALERLYRRYRDSGLEIVAVSLDTAPPGQDAADRVRAFVQELGLTFRILHDETGAAERIFQAVALPVTVVIGRTGRIEERVLGARAWDEPGYAKRIEKLLTH